MVDDLPTCCVLDIPASEAATDCPLYGLHECRYTGEPMSRQRRVPAARSAPPRQRYRHSRADVVGLHARRRRSERNPYPRCIHDGALTRPIDRRLRDADAADASQLESRVGA